MKIGTTLSPRITAKLIQFLKENLDVFAWSQEDMPGIALEIIQHKLNVNLDRKPIQQRRRVFAPKRDQAVADKVISSRFYPRSALPQVARKCRPGEEGKWEMENVRGLR